MDIKSVDKAITFVRQNGNQLDRLRLGKCLGEPFSAATAEAVLSPYQFPGGGWDYEAQDKDKDRVGSLGGTIHCLRWVREFNLGHTQLLTRTLDFLENIQSPDSSFYETEEKLAHSPQSWLQEETLIDRFYFTAAVPMRLFSVGIKKHPVLAPAIQWLERHWEDRKLITGTWYNLWALLCIYPAIDKLKPALYQRCYALALEWLPDLEPRPLTWLLDALYGAGYVRDERLVAEGVKCLLELQGKNGLWAEVKNSMLETTVTALRLLLNFEYIHTH